MFTYSGRLSTRRKASDGAAGEEGMASAIAEEHDGSDGAFVAGRKLVRISEHNVIAGLGRIGEKEGRPLDFQ